MDNDVWRDAIPEDTPPFFFRVGYDEWHGVDVVGRDGSGLFCIDDDEHDRSVWWVSERDPRLPRRFVNTSVERFRESLTTFYGTWRALRGLRPDTAALQRWPELTSAPRWAHAVPRSWHSH